MAVIENRLSNVAHLVDRKDRLIVEGRAVMGIGNDLPYVLGRHDAMHSLNRPRCARIDATDAPVCNGTADNLPVKHARQPQVVHVLRSPRDLRVRLETRNRATYDSARCRLRRYLQNV